MIIERRVEIGGIVQTVIGPADTATRQLQWDEVARDERAATGGNERRDFTVKTGEAVAAGAAWGKQLGGGKR